MGELGILRNILDNVRENIEHLDDRQIELGWHFFGGAEFEATAAKMFITVPSGGNEIRANFDGNAKQDGLFALYENPVLETTAGASGSALTLYNSNRNSDNAASLLTYTGAVISASGTLLYSKWVNAGQFLENFFTERDVILKDNTDYLFQWASSTTGTASLGIRYYEH